MKPFFEAAYSPLVKYSIEVGGPEHKKRLDDLLAATVREISGMADVVRSLEASIPGPDSCGFYRQCDLRSKPDGPIVIKTFTGWNKAGNCWRIVAEAPNETWFEDKQEKVECN